MLGVFLLLAFTCLGHEYQGLLNPCDEMCAQTRPWFILLSERVLRNGVRNYVNSKGKILSAGGSEEIRTRDAASCRTVSQTHYALPSFKPLVSEGQQEKHALHVPYLTMDCGNLHCGYIYSRNMLSMHHT